MESLTNLAQGNYLISVTKTQKAIKYLPKIFITYRTGVEFFEPGNLYILFSVSFMVFD